MNKQEKQMFVMFQEFMKQQQTDKKPVQQEKKEKNTPKTPPKTRIIAEIPEILRSMDKKSCIKTFGNMTLNPKETPYLCSVEKFFTEYGISPRKKKDGTELKPFLSRQLRHSIIIKQLTGENQKLFNTVKTNCIKFLQEKINAIPEDTTDISLMKRKEFNLQEMARWEHETYKK
jgi:hypothetical protein